MHAIDTSTAVNGQFTDGDPLQGIPPTEVDASWLNDMQANLLFVLQQTGIEPEVGDQTQLAKAIAQLISQVAPPSQAGSGGSGVAIYGLPAAAGLSGAADLNALLQSGFYLAAPGTLNIPPNANMGLVFSAAQTVANGVAAQIYVDAIDAVYFMRALSGGVWSAWAQLSQAQAAPQQPLASLGIDGWEWWPTGSFRQWGYIQGDFNELEVNVPFPVAFDQCFGIKGWVVNIQANVQVGTWIDEVTVTPNAGVVLVNRVSSGTADIPGFKWEAHGSRAAPPPQGPANDVVSGGSSSGGSSSSSGPTGGGSSGGGNTVQS